MTTANTYMVSDYMTAGEIATIIKVSIQTIQKWAKDGRLPCLRVGGDYRFESTEIIKRLKSGKLV